VGDPWQGVPPHPCLGQRARVLLRWPSRGGAALIGGSCSASRSFGFGLVAVALQPAGRAGVAVCGCEVAGVVDAEASCPLSPWHDVVDFFSAGVAADVAHVVVLGECALPLLGV
ncbi:MAG: hypothetical protein ACXVGG_04805, partial [Mycobacteriaceae bacterium]